MRRLWWVGSEGVGAPVQPGQDHAFPPTPLSSVPSTVPRTVQTPSENVTERTNEVRAGIWSQAGSGLGWTKRSLDRQTAAHLGTTFRGDAWAVSGDSVRAGGCMVL